jgi:hypothetical protein
LHKRPGIYFNEDLLKAYTAQQTLFKQLFFLLICHVVLQLIVTFAALYISDDDHAAGQFYRTLLVVDLINKNKIAKFPSQSAAYST